ncbi:MAG TPA: LytR C-terminal domain-containing protein, partial [Thermoleophilaceae bacterium]|nr:LytR C-terminal domain-containing protein [Thermoleophilaceae bacterium]
AKPADGGNAKPAPGGPATPAGGKPPSAPPVPPAAQGQRAPVRPMLPPRPMPQQTAIIPPPRQPWYRRLLASPRYLVLLVAGILILGGAGAFAVTELAGDDETGPVAGQSAAGGGGAGEGDEGDKGEGGNDRPGRRRVVPANVTVAILNGTTVPGLAGRLGEEVESFGFDVGTVANSADQAQQRAESVVLYAPGHEREATAVSRRLSINQRQPIDPASQELAGDATVVVIAGADRSQ